LITKKDLYETCCQFDIPLNSDQLTQLFDYCDPNRNGVIDYVEFANFLNWKNPMNTGFPKRKDVVCVALLALTVYILRLAQIKKY